MRVLLINKYYYLRSGTERYLLNLERLLRAEGHTVEVFAMQHPRNLPATYAADFAPGLEFHDLGVRDWPRAAARVLWSPEVARRLGRVVGAFQPDVAHLFNVYHHLSPSILPVLTRLGVPAVMTLNDYKLICPNYQLYTEGAPCTRCRDRRYVHAWRHRCLNGSAMWSALAAVEMSLHKALAVYERHVRAFIAPSAFVRATALAFGVPPAQLVELPYFLFPDDWVPAARDDGHLAYAGRLVGTKGLATLLRAMRRVPAARLLVVGEGPERRALEALAATLGLANVRFVGYLAGEPLARVLGGARFTVLPSEWYEVFGQSILESFAVGTPVVAARIGGMPEVIDEGPTGDGLLFPPGDDVALAACVARLWADPDGARAMGRRGLAKVRERYGPAPHYRALAALYARVAGR